MGCKQSKATGVINKPAPVIVQTQPGAQQETRPQNENREQPEGKIAISKQETDNKPEDNEGPLTKKQISVVQDTWSTVKDALDLEQVGVEFYVRLFTDSPELLQLFSFRDMELSEDVMRSDKRLKRQALVTIQHVDLAVTSLNDLGPIVTALKDLGARHVMYKVEEHHYGPVGAALLNTLDKGLGEKFTSDVREAWTVVYGIVADTMKSGAKELLEA